MVDGFDGDGFDKLLDAANAQFSAKPAPKRIDPPPVADWPFYCLGHDRGRYFLYTKGGRQVISMSAKDLSSHGQLLALAPLMWFESNFPTRDGFNARGVANEIITTCHKQGIFSPDIVRGRGVWLDAGRRVMHLGDHLIVDGIEMALTDIRGRYIYEQSRPLRVTLGEPLTDAEAKKFLALCCAVSWGDPTRDGRLFAGWIVSAIIGGALAWRPHIWLLAEGGGGKTWVQDNILTPALGDLALILQGKTTEAGVRGELGNDARPVMFDEAETQSDLDRVRMQQVIDLARQASSEHGGPIVKGTKEGGSRRYIIRSSFLFASINAGLTQAADESRFAVLTMVPGSADQFTALKAAHAEAMVENLAGRLLARILGMIPTIRTNADRLAEAIARTGAGRRAGDTLGSLLACQMALVDSREISLEEAAAMIEARAWVREAAAEAKVAPEWERAILHLMQSEGMRRAVNGRTENLTISEIIGACVHGREDLAFSEANDALRRIGMRVMDDNLMLGNRALGITDRFKSTPWGAGWLSTLARIPGARRNIPVRFSAMYQDKALSIPLAAITGGRA